MSVSTSDLTDSDLMAADESKLAADAELTRVLEPGMPGVDKRTVLAKMGMSSSASSRESPEHVDAAIVGI